MTESHMCSECKHLTMLYNHVSSNCTYWCNAPNINRQVHQIWQRVICIEFESLGMNDLMYIPICTICGEEARFLQIEGDDHYIPRCFDHRHGEHKKDWTLTSELDMLTLKAIVEQQWESYPYLDRRSYLSLKNKKKIKELDKKLKGLSKKQRKAFNYISASGKGAILVRSLNDNDKGALGKLRDVGLIEFYEVSKLYIHPKRDGKTIVKDFKAVRIIK